jgi:hypothetical protein
VTQTNAGSVASVGVTVCVVATTAGVETRVDGGGDSILEQLSEVDLTDGNLSLHIILCRRRKKAYGTKTSRPRIA